MQDPSPENITGSKQVSHVVEHKINWGHVAIGLAVIFVVWKMSGLLEGEASEDEQDVEIAVDAPARGVDGGGPLG